MSIVLLNLGGVALIAAIVWWFWLAKPHARRATPGGAVEILVEGGAYQPAHIEASLGRPLTLRFTRKDPTPCAEKVIFSDFGVSRDLPVGEAEELVLLPDRRGTFEFTCQMGMYRGRLIVK